MISRDQNLEFLATLLFEKFAFLKRIFFIGSIVYSVLPISKRDVIFWRTLELKTMTANYRRLKKNPPTGKIHNLALSVQFSYYSKLQGGPPLTRFLVMRFSLTQF